MKKLVYIILLTLSYCTTYCQKHPEAKRANHWYFGNGAGLDFSSGIPVAVSNGQLDSWESCASISDTSGNLLFYTDGDTIWDRNHNVMPNGTGLFGRCNPFGPNNSATQGVIIIPQPKSDSIFYMFTVDCAENLGARGMNYSVVDLSLNGGFGDVFLKNQLLFAPSTEGMAATMNCARDSIWVIGHEYGTDAFYTYLITENGLNTIPVTSNVGTVITGNAALPICISPNGKKISHATELLEFNFSNGQVNNEIFVPVIAGYGTSFSSNSKKLYSSISGNLILQIDATLNNTTDILNSIQYIYQGLSNDEYFGLQLANDNKIYVAPQDTTKITTIDFPNNNGAAVGFNPYSVDLNGKKCQFTFPSFVESYFTNNYNNDCHSINESSTKDTVFVPSIFTPNNDGYNDVFNIKISGYKNIDWKIYNRWGVLVKSGKLKVENDGYIDLWDGRTNAAQKVTDGTYYYIVNLIKNKATITKKGYIQLFN